LEVVVLVLQDVREVALGLEAAPFAAQVLVVDDEALGARHVLDREAGQRQAAVAAVLPALHGDDLGVDDHVLADHAPGAALLLGGQVLLLLGLVHHLALAGLGVLRGQADLGRGEADAVGGVHGLDHVAGEALQVGVEARDGVGAAPQDGVAVEDDRVYQGSSGRPPRAAAAPAGTARWRSGPAWRRRPP